MSEPRGNPQSFLLDVAWPKEAHSAKRGMPGNSSLEVGLLERTGHNKEGYYNLPGT